MYVMVLNVLAYAHDALMVTLYYSRTLGRRYSVKITALAAAGWWIVQSAGKLPAMYLADEYNMSTIMVVQFWWYSVCPCSPIFSRSTAPRW